MLNKLINAVPLAIAVGLVGQWCWSQMPKPSDASPKFSFNSPESKTNYYEPPSEQWNVVSVHDGDTIRIRRGSEEKKVRFACVDAPELKQPMGVQSRDYLRSLIKQSDNKVSIKVVDTDRYDRSVAEVWHDKGGGPELLQSKLAGAGMAYTYDRYKQNCLSWSAVTSAEAYAKSRSVGVWSQNLERPWDYRKGN